MIGYPFLIQSRKVHVPSSDVGPNLRGLLVSEVKKVLRCWKINLFSWGIEKGLRRRSCLVDIVI